MGERAGEYIVPLATIQTSCICDATTAVANAAHALSLRLPLLREISPPREGIISICGAGPSLRDTAKDLKGYVLATNSALGFLADAGINADAAMFFDADPRVAQFARPVDGCKYYVASRCDPGVFAALAGHDVCVWHAAGDAGLTEYLEANVPADSDQHAPLINGGSAAVTRAMFLAYVLGYRDIHLHGADSSFTDDTHVNGSIVPETRQEVFVAGRWFKSTPWMMAQAQEFETIYAGLGCKVTVHGDGLIPHMWRTLNATNVASNAA